MATILIVDDSGFARRVHRKMIESAGHSVIEASTGMGAIESFYMNQPDLLILDLSMEDVGGLDVLRKFKEMNTRVRAIVISADVQRTTEDLVRDAGAARFLGKPVTQEQLLETIDTVLAEDAK